MESIKASIKAFVKTRKGKSILISLVIGITGWSLPPEAIEALITLATVAGI